MPPIYSDAGSLIAYVLIALFIASIPVAFSWSISQIVIKVMTLLKRTMGNLRGGD
jgi:hypothetical protein